MATGSDRRLIFNTLEQVLSTDMNRLQAFAAADLAETMRYLLSVEQVDGFGFEPTSTGAPVQAEVIGGLVPRLVTQSNQMLVDPGAAWFLDPDPLPSLDDSPYKFIRDPGVSTNAPLILTANSSGSTRVDVIECSRIDVVTETSSRNEFNPVTGLFTPTTINKVARGQFQYRVRLGTPGSGTPAAVQGWLPLAVLVVPNGTTTTFDACTLYDVRPLVADRIHAPGNQDSSFDDYLKLSWLTADPLVNAGKLSAYGIVDGSVAGYKTGGSFPSPFGTGLIDLLNSANQEPGFTFPTAGIWHLYLVQPIVYQSPSGTIPRWRKYVGGNPGPLSGIPVVSRVTPGQTGIGAGIGLPTPSGLGGSGTGLLVGAGWATSGTPTGFYANGRTHQQQDNGISSLPQVNASPQTSTLQTFTFTAGTHFPYGAKALYLRLFSECSLPGSLNAAATNFQVATYLLSGTSLPFVCDWRWEDSNNPGTTDPAYLKGYVVRVPIQLSETPIRVDWSIVAGPLAFNNVGEATVLGWDL